MTAAFKVQQKQNDGTYADYPRGNAMTITTDPAKDYVISGFLPEGDQLVETSQSGYTGLDAHQVCHRAQPDYRRGQ